MKKVFASTIILFIIFLICGCADQQPQKVVTPQKIVKPTPQTKPGETVSGQPLEPPSAAIEYQYDPRGRRDPFASLIVREPLEKKKGVGPLEQEDIGSLRLIAVVWSGNQYHAMITLPDGKSYTVKRGMKLGIDGGVVYDITKDAVVVRQYLKDKKGTLKPKDLILRLRTEEQG